MTIEAEKFEIKKGAFGVVFIDKLNKTALKLFKSYSHPDLDGTGKEETGLEKTNKYRKKVFETQRDAYLKIQTSELLKKYTPKYYGSIKIDKVITGKKEVSNHYLLDCCYKIEYVEGELDDLKQGLIHLSKIRNTLSFNLDELIVEFRRCGVYYLEDSSAIWDEETFKIIDFGTIDPYEFEPIIE